MRSTRFWIILLALLLLASAAAAIALSRLAPGSVVTVSQDGRLLYRIDLSRVTEPYTITVDGAVENTIAVENGRIRVVAATCPDQICVHRGWITSSVTPIVCLPNGLVISMESPAGGDVDVIAF